MNGPSSERASPLNQSPCSVTRAPFAASLRVTVPFSMLKRSIDRLSGLNLIARFGVCTWPVGSRPRLICGPTRCISEACHSPRISGPSANSKPSRRARIVSLLLSPISMSCSESEGVGSSRASIGPVTRTLTPSSRLASASNKERWVPQSISNGPTNAAISARMIATANPSRVFCNSNSNANADPRSAARSRSTM